MKKVFMLCAMLVLLSACSKDVEVKKSYQEELAKAVDLVKKEEWEAAEEQLKDVPDDYNEDVVPLKKLIESNSAMLNGDFNSEFEKASMGLSYLTDVKSAGVSDDITNMVKSKRDELQTKVDEIIEKEEPKEKQIVEKAYDVLWNKARLADGDEYKSLLNEVEQMVDSYDTFKSKYKVDAHILYLYAQQSMLIKAYRDNMDVQNATNGIGTYDNHETYRQQFVDENRASMVEKIVELDPTNSGVILNSSVMASMKNGLKNFFDISEDDWVAMYNDRDRDWVEIAKNESDKNRLLSSIDPQVGMNKEEVIKTKWGRPDKVNTTTTSFGVREQWVYANYRYVYLKDGKVTAVQK